MQTISLSPFGRRPLTARLLADRATAARPAPLGGHDKWAIFDALRTARRHYAISDRDLTVLSALLSFLPGRHLEGDAALVVFPSNATLSARAHGMAESTLRRHVAALVAAGLIWRQDSPNGKRYARRTRSGDITVAYGFDLRPLLLQGHDILHAAAMITEEADALRHCREALVLRLRDATKCLAYAIQSDLPGDWPGLSDRLDRLRPVLRRKTSAGQLAVALQDAEDLLAHLMGLLAPKTTIVGGNDVRNERHPTSSETEPDESESCLEQEASETASSEICIPLPLIQKACPDLALYARRPVRTWNGLVETIGEIRTMMGIAGPLWQQAKDVMGPRIAAATVSAMLQDIARIRSPGAYLRALCLRAANGTFSPAPMIMALLNRRRCES